jgi:hypothetical protein
LIGVDRLGIDQRANAFQPARQGRRKRPINHVAVYRHGSDMKTTAAGDLGIIVNTNFTLPFQ